MNNCNDWMNKIWLFSVELLHFGYEHHSFESMSVIVQLCLHAGNKSLTLEFVSCWRWIAFQRSGTISCSLHKAEERGKTSSQSNSAILLKATSTDLLLLRETGKRPLSVSWRECEAAFTVYLSTCLVPRQRKRPTCKFSKQFCENGIQGSDKLSYLNYSELADIKEILSGTLVSGFAFNLRL